MEPSEEERQAAIDKFAQEVNVRVQRMAMRRLYEEKVATWLDAFNKRGPGSTFERANIIGNRIYEQATPIPDMVPSVDGNAFLREIRSLVREAAEGIAILAYFGDARSALMRVRRVEAGS
jgi:hypothetical protein